METTQRTDVFDRLLARQAISQGAHQAIRRLDADMTEHRGGKGERGAGENVDAVLKLIGQRDRLLLRELLEPRQVMVGESFERWRQVVAVLTGETSAHAQGAVVRAAAENLALAYLKIDRSPRRVA